MGERLTEVSSLGPLRGELRVPGDKSISHRALLLSALADRPSSIRGLSGAEDVRATAAALVALGVGVDEQRDSWVVTPPAALREPDSVLDCGNSGTSMRLLCGLLAPRVPFAVLTGDDSLRSRPMERVVEPLRDMGARIDGRHGGSRAPLAVRGARLEAARHDLRVASAQVKSALLLAGLDCGVAVREPMRSRDHTERMLKAMGATLRRDPEGWLVLDPGGPLRAVDWQVPGDLSSAAFFLVAATLVPGSEVRVPRIGLNRTRSGVIDALRAMGADIETRSVDGDGAEALGDLVVRSARLRGTTIDGELALRCLDELPVLAVAAAFAEGRTVISGAAELRVKESDRIARVAQGLRALHVDVEELPDGLVIDGGAPRGPARIDASGDHRVAMAFAVAGLLAPGGVQLVGASSVRSSYPRFFHDLAGLRP